MRSGTRVTAAAVAVVVGSMAAGTLGVSGPRGVAAQAMERAVEAGVMVALTVESEAWESFPPVPAVVRVASEGRGGVSWSGVAHTVGGALVGGWLGYVGSQVVRSDWDKEANGAFRGERSVWAAAGALLGIAGSQALGPSTPAPESLSPLEPFDRERRVITEREIRAYRAETAYEVVAGLRPEWLVTRGGDGGGSRTPKVTVYLNDVRLGDADRLRQVGTGSLTGARFLTVREATLRYGMGHRHGAILLTTAVPAP